MKIFWLKRALVAGALVVWSLGGQAASATRAVVVTHQTVAAAVVPASGATPEIVVFYLGKGQPSEITRDGVPMQMGWDLPVSPSASSRPLVVLSHGSDGNPWQNSDLAKQLVLAGFVVAAPLHKGDSSRDHAHSTLTTWDNWRLRPTHVTATIDVMAHSKRWQVRTDRVGVFGMSAGGHTALTMAGGKWSPDRFRQHCNQHIREDLLICSEGRRQLKGDWLDWLRIAVTLASVNYHMRDETWYGHADPRVTAVVAEVPVLAEFDMQSLVSSSRAIGVVQALADQFVNPKLHSGALLRACSHCVELASVPGAGHSSLLSPVATSAVEKNTLSFDRRVVADVEARIVAFFERKLVDGSDKKGGP